MDSSRSAAEVLAELGLGEDDLAAWERSGLAPEAFDDWITDRIARKPEGRRAREIYGADDVHDFARHAILADLAPGPGERLLEIGCGGGLLLREASATGAATTGVDHSADMVELARQRAPDSDVRQADAEALPFPRSSFDAVAMSVVFFFLHNPITVLRECHRVLVPSGRVAIYTTAPELRGTPAAPEPIAHLGHFYSDAELVRLANDAGFTRARVDNDGGGQLLTAHV